MTKIWPRYKYQHKCPKVLCKLIKLLYKHKKSMLAQHKCKIQNNVRVIVRTPTVAQHLVWERLYCKNTQKIPRNLRFTFLVITQLESECAFIVKKYAKILLVRQNNRVAILGRFADFKTITIKMLTKALLVLNKLLWESRCFWNKPIQWMCFLLDLLLI